MFCQPQVNLSNFPVERYGAHATAGFFEEAASRQLRSACALSSPGVLPLPHGVWCMLGNKQRGETYGGLQLVKRTHVGKADLYCLFFMGGSDNGIASLPFLVDKQEYEQLQVNLGLLPSTLR